MSSDSGVPADALPAPSRRRFVQGLATAVAITGLGAWPKPVWALKSPGDPVVLSGTQFDLVIGQTPMTITGRTRERR